MVHLPGYTDFFNPVLHALRDLGGSARPMEVQDHIVDSLRLTEEQIALENRDGVSTLYNRIAWARFYLARAGYLDSSRRGVWALTEAGRSAAQLSPAEVQDICRGVQARNRDGDNSQTNQLPIDPIHDVDETDSAPRAPFPHREEVKALLRAMSANGFERFCQRLLREAGFESVEVTGRSGDGGIDGHGLLRVNPLVSFKVIFQSKRHAGPIGSPQIRDFRGAMTGRADRGLFITTSMFSREAQREAARDGAEPIELVDADGILDLLEQLELGLAPVSAYGVDTEFFAEFRE
jgi:restriction system protein